MSANPRIQKLGHELIGLYMAEGVTCEEDVRRKACYGVPEYRCLLGPFTGGSGVINSTKDLCPIHARAFAKTFHLRLPTSK
jgi:hypothetical protein